jgi:predicted DNA-binding ribbon-helix-helix protein
MLEKRSFSLSGHRTSIALEAEFWAALEAVAAARGVSLLALIGEVDGGRVPEQPLASALRVFALRARADEGVDGRVEPGHDEGRKV